MKRIEEALVRIEYACSREAEYVTECRRSADHDFRWPALAGALQGLMAEIRSAARAIRREVDAAKAKEESHR